MLYRTFATHRGRHKRLVLAQGSVQIELQTLHLTFDGSSLKKKVLYPSEAGIRCLLNEVVEIVLSQFFDTKM